MSSAALSSAGLAAAYQDDARAGKGLPDLTALAPYEILASLIKHPAGVAVAADGRVFATEASKDRVWTIQPDGSLRTLTDRIEKPGGVVWAASDHLLVLGDRLREERGDKPDERFAPGVLVRMDLASGRLDVLLDGLRHPRALALDGSGAVYVSVEDWPRGDGESGPGGAVVRWTAEDGLRLLARGFSKPSGIAVQPSGAVLVAATRYRRGPDRLESTVFAIDQATGDVDTYLDAGLFEPVSLALDVTGALWLAAEKRVGKERTGVIIKHVLDAETVFATGLEKPWGLAFSARGDLVTSDARGDVIVRFTAPEGPAVGPDEVATNRDPFILAGTAPAESRILVDGGTARVTGDVEAGGGFQVSVGLRHNAVNRLSAISIGARGEGLASAPTRVIVLHDDVAPVVAVSVVPPPNAAGWHRTPATVGFICTDGGSGVSACPAPVTVSTEGAAQSVAAVVVDRAGNQAAAGAIVNLDSTVPSMTIVHPADQAVVNDARLVVQGTVADALSGVGAVTCNGEPATVYPGSFSCIRTLTAGVNTIVVATTDVAGNTSTAQRTVTFSATTFRAIAECSPTQGAVPLTVQFRSRGEFSGGSIVRYRWDFDGNGTFDSSDPVARDFVRTFDTAGTRVAVLEVTNNFGQTATDRCTITASGREPTATANAVPSNGPAPLDVRLACVGTDVDGTIVKYEWDVDGDGAFDLTSPSTGVLTHRYVDPGQFVATCRVTDNDGLSGTARTINTVIRPGPPGSPTIEAVASPASGNAPLMVSFNGTSAGPAPIVLWEWDFDGDGTFDFSSASSPATSHRYTDGGVFAATLRATDDTGLSSLDNVEIAVNLVATLSIADDTFDPSAGERASIDTSMTAGVPVRLLITDSSRRTRRVLVNQFRAAGSYSDNWDGTDDDGRPLPHGAYFAVLEYTVGGRVLTVDSTDTTGGARYNPSRSPIPSVFRPLEDDLLDITFVIPSSFGASEVTAFIGLFNTDTRLVTLLERVPFGVGSHTIFWDGTDPSGGLAAPPPGDSFLFGIFGFTLPTNAIMLQAAPVLSGVRVDPNYFNPSTPDYGSSSEALATITYSLDKPANVELTVTNLTTGADIRRIVAANVQPGTDLVIAWDGRAGSGLYVDKGDYRLSLRAVDSTGAASITRFALVRVFH